ncbi:MAG: membrane dipeptidase [Chloroflexi bacterium]|nr:membrane dipeptidase [Chloroflexota bacterium]
MPTPYLIVDAHEDLAYNALTLGRDPRIAAHETRAREPAKGVDGIATVGLPNFLAGNVRVVFGTIYVSPEGNFNPAGKNYKTPEQAEALAQEQLAYYALMAGNPQVSLITSRSDLKRVIDSRESRLGLVILMEGADPIVKPQDTRKWYEGGVRVIGPAWSQTRYSGGTGKPGPLTELGKQLMREMSRLGLILDISHLAEESFFEALDLFEGTVVASHSNVRKFVPTDRHLSDDMIRALVNRDGVIGAVFYNQFLKYQWRQNGADKKAVTFATVIEHIKYICDLAGSARHCGIGTDFDGGFGMESAPSEIDTVADLQKFGTALADAGFGDDDVRGIMGGNWLRILERALPD